MAFKRNPFKITIACLVLYIAWLAVCNPLSTFTSSPSPDLILKSPTSVSIATHTNVPKQTEMPTPTLDIWEIQNCPKAKDVLEIEPDFIWQYIGDFDGGRVEMLLNFTEEDNRILYASRQFINAVANNDRTQVIEMIRFPVEIWMNGAPAEVRTPEMFLAYYNSIFDDGFRERLTITFPNYLMANAGNFVGTISQFIYGGGGLTFDEHGKVIGIFNWHEASPIPTAAIQ